MSESKSIKTISGKRYRRCCHCHEWYPEDREFFWRKSRADGGFQDACIECCKEAYNEKEKFKEGTRQYRKEHILDSTSLGKAVADSMRPIGEEIL